MKVAVDPTRCPLCGNANGCQLAAGEATCWCFETPVPNEILARVPAEAQSVACVCRRCAAGDAAMNENTRRRLAMRWTRR